MPDTTATFVYLASGSPRRRELLTQIGVTFRGLSIAVDETPGAGEAAADYVLRLARAKAAAGAALVAAGAAGAVEAAPVLGADTAVVLDGRILGKPRDADDGRRMLLDLSGRSHEVLTAVALASPPLASPALAQTAPEAAAVSRLSRSQVTFRVIAPEEAAAYWSTAEPGDKAGGYAIQGRGAVFVTHLAGSFSGVMGLPLFETAQLLDAAGVPRWGAP